MWSSELVVMHKVVAPELVPNRKSCCLKKNSVSIYPVICESKQKCLKIVITKKCYHHLTVITIFVFIYPFLLLLY